MSTNLLTTPAVHAAAPPAIGGEPTAAQIERQKRREKDAVNGGIKRYNDAQREIRKEHGIGYTAAAMSIVRSAAGTITVAKPLTELMEPLTEQLSSQRDAVERSSAPGASEWRSRLLLLEPHVFAWFTLRAIMAAVPNQEGRRRKVTDAAKYLIELIELQCKFNEEAEKDRKDEDRKKHKRNKLIPEYESKVKKRDARSFRRFLKRKELAFNRPWSPAERLLFGSALITWAIQYSNGIFEFVLVPGKSGGVTKDGKAWKKTARCIELTEYGKQRLKDYDARKELEAPLALPMICPPRPWRWDASRRRYDGGYYSMSERFPLLRQEDVDEHTGDLDAPFSDAALAALNTLQNVPWRINAAILDVMEAAWDAALPLECMPPPEDLPPLAREPDEIWKSWQENDDPRRKKHLAEGAEIHAENERRVSKRKAWLNRRDTARDVRNEPAIYFPYSTCFRGRLYPIAEALSPQGNDASRALLMFARGKPLGPDGLRWLCIRAANCYGMDKLSLAERVEWTERHRKEIEACAAAPLDELWWSETKEDPWSFLATCFELSAAWKLDDPATFVSHLPIPQDGTCNGLQHLAALALDRRGGEAVNLVPSYKVMQMPVGGRGISAGSRVMHEMLGQTNDDAPAPFAVRVSTRGPEGRSRTEPLKELLKTLEKRHDIYADVADLVKLQVAKDAGKGHPEALKWHGYITRDVVKRAVMTTPYGVTPRGIRDQLLDDGKEGHKDFMAHIPFEERHDAAAYLRDCLVEEIEKKVPSAKQIKDWLQSVASALRAHDKPFRWQTPSGNTLQQGYWEDEEKRTNTLAGKLTYYVKQTTAPRLRRKQTVAVTPNVIHSFDAAHLVRTVNACLEAGVTSFAMIHDSFATHAADSSTMAHILRAEFRGIYRENWLQKIEDYVRSYAGNVPIPSWGEYVKLHRLDIEGVMDNEFFFS